jgi:beta-lactamase class A
VIITIIAILLLPIVVIQLFYSTTSLLPNMSVGSVAVGGLKKSEAIAKLDTAYAKAKVPIYLSDSDEVAVQPTLSNLGFSIKNQARVDAYDYPFLARLIPYSLFWYQTIINKGEPQIAQSNEALISYVNQRFGENCEFEPVNGTIVFADDALQVVEASRGGSCDPAELLSKLKGVSVRLSPGKITIKGTSTAPEISTAETQEEFDRLMAQLGDGVALKVEDESKLIPKNTVAQWILYTVQDDALLLNLHSDKVTQWLTDTYGKQYTSSAGTTVVTLTDYAESSRETGNSGQAINMSETITAITKDLSGEQATAKLVVDTLEPKVEYKRAYSPSNTAISAVMKQYADTHTGTYGVKLVELSGSRRNAEYNAGQVFTTASTYKLFVAYSILLRIERGEIQWTDQSFGSYTVSTCFDRMIKLSDNNCAVWFLLKVSYEGVTADAHALGATHTNFVRSTGITSTTEDEAFFVSLLYSDQLLSQQASRDRLIEAMKGNVYVAGIPTGIPNATVANKVGFLDGLLHDAAIVYSPTGDYVLIIMTNNASWANIAELAGQIETARAK